MPAGRRGARSGGGGSAGVTDHGALIGLADDDHTAYATNVELTAHDGDTTSVHGITDTSALLTTATAAGGDLTGTLGNLQYGAGSIGNADVSSSAEIVESKLALSRADPADQGLVAWTVDPAHNKAHILPHATGYTVFLRLQAPSATAVTKLYLHVTSTPATNLTTNQCIAGLYNSDLTTKLSESGDLSVTLTTTGIKTITLTPSVALTAGALYHVALLLNGTGTFPSFAAGSEWATLNVGATGLGTWRVFRHLGPNTSLPASYAAGLVDYPYSIFAALGA